MICFAKCITLKLYACMLIKNEKSHSLCVLQLGYFSWNSVINSLWTVKYIYPPQWLCWFRGPIQRGDNNIGFLCNSDPDPLKNHKVTKPAFNVGPTSACQRNAIKITFHWRGRWWPNYSGTFGSSMPSKKEEKKALSNLDPLWHNFLDLHMDIVIDFVIAPIMWGSFVLFCDSVFCVLSSMAMVAPRRSRSQRGVVVKLHLELRGSEFDPWLLQSVRWDC